MRVHQRRNFNERKGTGYQRNTDANKNVQKFYGIKLGSRTTSRAQDKIATKQWTDHRTQAVERLRKVDSLITCALVPKRGDKRMCDRLQRSETTRQNKQS